MEERICKCLEVFGLVAIGYSIYKYGKYQYDRGYSAGTKKNSNEE